MPRKRTHDEMTASEPAETKELSLLQKIRNMWEFANVYQFICIFGKVVKIDEDFDIEDFENECLRPGYSEKLEEIGLQLLKWVSSHRGLNYDIWDEYTRRQYQSKAPNRNPYGDDEEPKKFRHFDIFTKIRVLHQLTVWTLWNPDRMRQVMPEHQKETDQVEWRIEPLGWDEDEREYYVLDDNRLYRRTEPPIPEPTQPKTKTKLKYTSKKAQAARRRERAAAKRRKVEDSDEDTDMQNGDDDGNETKAEETEASVPLEEEVETDPSKIDTNGGYTWECIAVTLEEYTNFMDSIKKTRDANQKILRESLITNIIPEIEKQAELQQRKAERRAKELAVMERLATAKRSSRLADKHDRERREAEAAEAERQRAATLAEARREEERQKQMEQERHSRMMTREQRIKEREYKRVLMEEQLARDAEEQKKIEEGEARGSSRQLKERIEKSLKELEELQEEDWSFDCSGCGKHGKNFDDGQHSVACERCNVWQHSKCLGISKTAAERDDFHFICKDCHRKEEEAKRPKISLKFKLGSSSSPPPVPSSPAGINSPQSQRLPGVTGPALNHQPRESVTGSVINGQFYPAQSPPKAQQVSPQPAGISSLHPSPQGNVQRGGPASNSPPAHPHYQQYAAVNGYQVPVQFSGGYPQTGYYQQYPPPPSRVQYPPSHGVIPQTHAQPSFHHYHHYTHTPQPPTQRPIPSDPQANTSFSSDHGRLPSPVINRPTMSPTQGNPDVGPIAGVPGSSPPPRNANMATPQVNGARSHQDRTPIHSGQQDSPRQTSFQHSMHPSYPPMQPISGLSPIKQRTHSPLPPPSDIPMKLSASRSPPSNPPNIQPSGRSVSGTPIFPPAEKLAPSPDQMYKSPMPTPSKQPTPAEVEEAEQKRHSSSFSSANGFASSSPVPAQAPQGLLGQAGNQPSSQHREFEPARQ